jgi:diguanylate cyclase (GGDEF)-like protein
MAGNEGKRRDPMTGLFHGREISGFIVEAIEQGREQTEPLSMIIIDIDDLKVIDDNHGLLAGDYVINEIVGLLIKNVPGNCIAARSGGDEFTVILPSTPIESARQLAQQLCEVVAAHTFQFKYDHEEESRRLRVSISAGATGIRTNVPDTVPALIYDLISRGYEDLRVQKSYSKRHSMAGSQASVPESSHQSLVARFRARLASIKRRLRKE